MISRALCNRCDDRPDLRLGEVMPKTYAITKPEPSAMLMARVIRFLHMIFKPLTQGADWLAKGTLRLFGVKLYDKM